MAPFLALNACSHPAPDPSRDIVSLSPAVSVALADMGLSSRLAGVTTDDPVCPPACARLGRIGALDSESLLALKPQIVFAIGDGQMAVDAPVRRRAEGGQFRLVPLANARTAEEAFAQVAQVGEAVGAQAQAGACIARARGRMKAAEDLARARSALRMLDFSAAKPPRVLLLSSVNPQPAALGPGFVHDELLRRLGAQNALPANAPGWLTLDREAIRAMAPDVVVFLSAQERPQEAARAGADLRALLAGMDIPAVKAGRTRVITDPLAMIPSTNLPKLQESLAEAIFGNPPPKGQP